MSIVVPLLTSAPPDKLNKKHQVTEVDITFSGQVNSTEADAIATYRLATPGKKGSYTAKNAGIIKLKKAVYTGSTSTVALTPKKPFALSKPVQVVVFGTGPTAVEDTYGRDIDGDRNGTAGGNAIAIIGKTGAKINAVTDSQGAAANGSAGMARSSIRSWNSGWWRIGSRAASLRKASAVR
jgi:hypothetical protein